MTCEWSLVESILNDNYDHPDCQAAKILFAGVAAHRLVDFPPAWELLMAPSGSMKTDLLESLRGLPRVNFVDEVTPKTFISGKVDDVGKRRKCPASYLHRLGDDAILIAADFSTVTSQDSKALASILSQLRRIYDGKYAREFGADENLEERSWSGRLTLIAGGTPSIDGQWTVYQALGERFVRVRWPRAGGVSAGVSALRHTQHLGPLLRDAVHKLLLPVLSMPIADIAVPTLSPEMEVRIASLTELIALGRITVQRERSTHAITAEPAAEGNTRLPQQLAQIGRGWAFLCGRAVVNAEGFALIERTAFDCLPPTRRDVLKALIRGESPYWNGPAGGLVFRAITDLELAGLVAKAANGSAELTPYASELVANAGLSSPNLPYKAEERDEAPYVPEFGGKQAVTNPGLAGISRGVETLVSKELAAAEAVRKARG